MKTIWLMKKCIANLFSFRMIMWNDKGATSLGSVRTGHSKLSNDKSFSLPTSSTGVKPWNLWLAALDDKLFIKRLAKHNGTKYIYVRPLNEKLEICSRNSLALQNLFGNSIKEE